VTFQAFSSLSVERNVFIDVFVPRKFLFMETFLAEKRRLWGLEVKNKRWSGCYKSTRNWWRLYHLQDEHCWWSFNGGI